jgi:presenilin-like A22 family membrane protease
VTSTLASRARLQWDLKALGLVALFVVVIGGALAARPTAVSTGAEPAFSDTSTAGQAVGGAGWAIVEALFAAALLGGILLWRRVPGWLQESLLSAAKFGVPMFIGGYAAVSGSFAGWTAFCVSAVAVLKAVDEWDCWWAVNNLLAVGLAIYIGVAAGIVLGPVVIGVGFVGLAVYDYVFADRRTWMFTLSAWTVRQRLPALFIVPQWWRFDWEALAEAFEADSDVEGEDVMRWGIGMADLALPAAFAVAIAASGNGLALAGAVAGILIACARVSQKIDDGGGAGLPPLATGALGGWAVAAGIGVIVA